METLNAKLLIAQAKERLEGKDARKMAFFHTGIIAAFALVVTVLQYVLQLGIAETGGLSGMRTIALLQTMQTVLQWANMILAPFWNLGFIYVTLLWARDKYARKEDLLTGFHRISPYIGLVLLRGVLIGAVLIVAVYASSAVFMMLPASQTITDIAMQTNVDPEAIAEYLYQMTDAQTLELMRAMIPMLVISAVLAVAILVPLMYRFRMAEYVILNQKGMRALPAMIVSVALLRRRCWKLFKLDLHLWWYYALKVICILLCYLELILGAMGIALPLGTDGAAFAAYGLYLLGLLAVETLFRPQVQTTYGVLYETCVAAGPVQKANPPAKPQSVPWDEQ